jgi:hypothetical protein
MPSIEGRLRLYMPSIEGRLRLDMPSIEGRLGLDMPSIEGRLRLDMPSIEGRLRLDMPSIGGRLGLDMPSIEGRLRLIGSYIRSWERPGDLPRVIEILCLFASGAQRNERKRHKNFYHELKITRAFPTTHVSTYFFRKPTTFTIANS